jgi:NAD-dependent DNA ligase
MDLHQEFKNSRFFHEQRIDQRSAESLIGICSGLIADGTINQQEAEFLSRWIERHLVQLEDPVINLLYRRLSDMLSDGILQPDEAVELLDMLRQLAGNPTDTGRPFTAPTTLPLNNPAPELAWPDHTFVFTGVMAYGPRKDCELLVTARGGSTSNTISRKVNFLVIGSIGNEQWLNSTYGTKIKKAVELRENGTPIALVSEEHWQSALFG